MSSPPRCYGQVGAHRCVDNSFLGSPPTWTILMSTLSKVSFHLASLVGQAGGFAISEWRGAWRLPCLRDRGPLLRKGVQAAKRRLNPRVRTGKQRVLIPVRQRRKTIFHEWARMSSWSRQRKIGFTVGKKWDEEVIIEYGASSLMT